MTINTIRWRFAQWGETLFWKRWLKTHENDDEWLAKVLEYFDLTKKTDFGNQTLVDIGSGPIGILTKLKAKRKIAVDPLPIDTFDKSIERIKAPGEAIPLADKIADNVFMYNVLQHVISPEKVLEEGNRILKPGGKFFIVDQLYLPTDREHPHSLTLELFDTWVKANKLKVVKRVAESDNSFYESNNQGYTLLCLIVQKNK